MLLLSLFAICVRSYVICSGRMRRTEAELRGYKVEVPLTAEREAIAKYPKMGL